jgi:hypothetical protein
MPKLKRTRSEINRDIEEQQKDCSVCGNRKPFDCFYNYKNKSDGKSYRCKDCDDLARKKWKEDNLVSSKLSMRKNNLKSKYGISLDAYNYLLRHQGYRCAICETTENNVIGERSHWNFAVDHNHDTGKVRGLLCNQCNRAIGMLKDDATLLRKAADYLDITNA